MSALASARMTMVRRQKPGVLAQVQQPSEFFRPGPLGEITAGQLFDLYHREYVQVVNKPSTWQGRRIHLDRFAAMWGHRPAESLTWREVEKWALERKRECAAATLVREVGVLSKAYSWGIRQELVKQNPARSLQLGALRTTKRHQWLSLKDEPALRAAYLLHAGYYLTKVLGPEKAGQRTPEDDWGLVRFAILTGCRRGEMVHMRPKHVRGEDLVIPDEGKTGTRVIPLHPEARRVAERWIDISQRSGSDFIFWPEFKDQRLVRVNQYVILTWQRAAKRAGMAHLWWRDLRRTFGCRLIALKTPIFEVQKLLGHASPQMTMVYCYVQLPQLRDSILKLK